MKNKKSKIYFKKLKDNYEFLIDGIDENFFTKMDLVFKETNSLELVINSISQENKDYILKRVNETSNLKLYSPTDLIAKDITTLESLVKNYYAKCDLVIKSIVYRYFQERYINQILKSVSNVFQIDAQNIKSKVRLKEYVEARYCFIHIVSKYDDFITLKEIAKLIHEDYDHSSVIHALKNIDYFVEKRNNFEYFNKRYDRVIIEVDSIFKTFKEVEVLESELII